MNIPRQRRPATSRIAEDGVNAVRAVINAMNCQFRTGEPDNAALDGEIQLVNKLGEFEGHILKCQVKAGRSYIAGESSHELAIRLERRHVDLWNRMTIPVLLFYYDESHRKVYWIAVQKYLESRPALLAATTLAVTFIFRKSEDEFSVDAYEALGQVADGSYSYTAPVVAERHEVLRCNWFEVLEVPGHVYKAPSIVPDKRFLPEDSVLSCAFTIRQGHLYTFSSPGDKLEFLSEVADFGRATQVPAADIKSELLAELLNSALRVFASKSGLKELRANSFKFTFPIELLSTPLHNSFLQTSLAGRRTRRTLILERRTGRVTEYERHACYIRFIQVADDLRCVELDPFMDYHYSRRPDPFQARSRSISSRQNTFNSNYLYMLHFWKQFLSGNSDRIRIATDVSTDPPVILVDTTNTYVESEYSLLNDMLQYDDR